MKKIIKKYKKQLIIILIIGILLFLYLKPNNKEFYYISKSNIYYNDKKISKNFVFDKIELSKDNNKVLYYEDNYLYLYNKKKNKSTKIKKDVLDYKFINNDFIYLDNDNNLYFYNKKEKLISKSIMNINYVTNKEVIYTKDKKIYSYNINNKNNKLVSDYYIFDISEDNSNLLLHKKDFKIYSLNKNKIINTEKDITSYYCINDSCTNYYYLVNDHLKSNTNKKLNEDISSLEYFDNNTIIYTKYDNEYILYYKKKNSKSIKLVSSKDNIYNIKIVGNTIYYVSNDNLYSIKTNGNSSKKIIENVTDIIDIYNNKILLIKDNNLYLNNKKLVKNVNKDSIKIINNKAYVITDVEDNNSFYIINNSKAKKISNKVNNYWNVNNTIYYLGDYDTSKNSGNLYKYNKKKVVIKNISKIIVNED